MERSKKIGSCYSVILKRHRLLHSHSSAKKKEVLAFIFMSKANKTKSLSTKNQSQNLLLILAWSTCFSRRNSKGQQPHMLMSIILLLLYFFFFFSKWLDREWKVELFHQKSPNSGNYNTYKNILTCLNLFVFWLKINYESGILTRSTYIYIRVWIKCVKNN